MSGLDSKTPIPTEITLHTKSRMLEPFGVKGLA